MRQWLIAATALACASMAGAVTAVRAGDEYFVQQMMDFRNGARKTSDPRKANTGLMARFAKMMSDDEIKAAAQYFTAIPATPWITVVESASVPKSKPQNGMYLRLEGAEAGVEPIGE